MKLSIIAIVLTTILVPTLMTSAQAKTAKECTAEWQANKAANQAAKITEKAYVDKCKSADATPAAPTVKPAKPTAPKTAAPAPAATPPVEKPAAKATAPAPASGAAGANQYASDTQAKARCPADIVVWVNLDSKIYHFAGKKEYGTTKKGTYMCEKDAMAAGNRASKAEKRP
jgi:hypothetical protein